MLLTCSLGAKPPAPIAIYKESDGEGSDLSIPVMNLQAGQLVWNTRLAELEPAFIQRYLYNGSPCAFILRVTFQPTLNNFTYHIFQNILSVAKSKHQFNRSLRFAFNERRATIRRGHTSVIWLESDHEDCTPADRYCVATSKPETYEIAQWREIASVKSQMLALKTVLERGYLHQFHLELLEVVADFCQDKDKKWYFMNLHSYKTVLIVKKKITSDTLDKLLVRLLSPVTRPKSANPPLKKHRKRPRKRLKRALTFSHQRDLSQSTDDLRKSMVDDILRDISSRPVHKAKRKSLK